MKQRLNLMMLCSALLFANASLFSSTRIYQIRPVENQSPEIDGHFSDTAWNTCEWMGDFVQTSPIDGADPSQKTVFKLTYDQNNIYVAIRAYDTEPETISSRATRRDGDFDADMVGVAFDSFMDKRTSFQFYVTAAGVKHDRISINDNQYDVNSNWNPVWEVSTQKDSLGWTAEMRIARSMSPLDR